MQITNMNFLSSRDVKYFYDDVNLFEMRRAKLRLLARSMGLPAEGSKNELLQLLLGKLDSIGAPENLNELHAFEEPEPEKEAPAAPVFDRVAAKAKPAKKKAPKKKKGGSK